MKKIKYIIGIIMGIFIFSGMLLMINGMNKKSVSAPVKMQKENTVPTQAVDLPRTYNAYDAQITFDSALNTFRGTETIKYTHEFNAPTHQIVLKLFANEDKQVEELKRLNYSILEEITISTVKIGGQDISFKQRGTSLTVYLDAPLCYQDEIELGLEFSGSIYKAAGDYNEKSRVVMAKSILPQLAPFKENEGWIINERDGEDKFAYAEPADYHVTILSHKFVVATGSLISSELQEDGYNKYIFSAKMVRDFGIYIGEQLTMQEYELPKDKTLVIYTNKTVDLNKLVAKVGEVFDYYSDILGTYPYERFTIVDNNVLDDVTSYPMLMLYDFKDMNSVYEDIYTYIGKQWIPYILCNDPKVNNWINSGLESYIAYRGKQSIGTIKNRVEYQLNSYTQNQDEVTDEEKLYINTILKPMQMLTRVEQYLGEEVWHEKLRQYYKSSAFKTTPNNQLMVSIIEDYGNAVQFANEEITQY